MTVGDILDETRALYSDKFAAAVMEHRAAGQVLTEVALRDESGSPLREGDLQLPMRVDIVILDGEQRGQSISVDSTSLISFGIRRFRWGERLEVTLMPFFWDDVRVAFEVANASRGWVPLRRWFMQWFSPDDDGNGETLGLVHFLSDPKLVMSGHEFTVDLGTAPVEALEELFDAVEALGATAVEIGGGPAAT